MEKTQRLLSIALTALALDGCAAALQAERPELTPTPRATSGHGSSSRSSSHHSSVHHWWHHAGAGAVGAAAAGAAAGAHDRTLGGKNGKGRGGGFGKGGAHGHGG